MGRPAEGWKLTRKPGRLSFSVKFTHNGNAYERGTGESDEARAAKRAAEIYAGIVSGLTDTAPRKRHALEIRPIGPAAQSWLDSVAQTLDQKTLDTYLGYVTCHFEPFFRSIEAITHDSVKKYIQFRLKSILAITVKKEIGALRGLLDSASGEGSGMRIVPRGIVPRRAVGQRHPKGKRSKSPLAPWEVYEILQRLPKDFARNGRRSHCRARYVLAYETGLRPETLASISVPEHYSKGATHLRITDEIDKARFGRELPLTDRARAVLESIAPDLGLILGPGTHRKALRLAAVPVIGPERAAALHPYALRGNRLTHLCEASGNNLPGVQWLAGHKKLSTTAIYAQGSLRAAEDVLRVR